MYYCRADTVQSSAAVANISLVGCTSMALIQRACAVTCKSVVVARPAPRAIWKACRGGARGQCSRPTAATACVTAAPCRGRWGRHLVRVGVRRRAEGVGIATWLGLGLGLGLQRRAEGVRVATKAGVGAAGAPWSHHQEQQLAVGGSARLIGRW
eukprot:scaffold23711_cov28-Phaeocystis_antarctica.AAC.2